MILLAALAGLRAHEIAKVRGEDVDPVERTLRVTGKGNVTAVLPLHRDLVELAATMPPPRLVVPRQQSPAGPGHHLPGGVADRQPGLRTG